jgi:hypothetical protein
VNNTGILNSNTYSTSGSNSLNLGGSTPVSGSGTGLQYDQWGNIIGG